MKNRTSEHRALKYTTQTEKHIKNKFKMMGLLLCLIFSLSTPIQVFADTPIYPENFKAEQQMHQHLKAKGYEESYVSFENSVLLVRIEASGMEESLPLDWSEIAVFGNKLFGTADKIIVEAYMEKKPLLMITMDALNVSEYAQKAITLNEFWDKVVINDVRSREELFRESLLPLDISIHDIRIYNKYIEVFASYMGADEQGMLEDYITIAHAALKSAPWVDKVVVDLSVENWMGEISFSARTNDILDLLEGTITEEKFFSRVNMNTQAYEPLNGWRRTLYNTIQKIRSLPYGNTVLLVIMAIVALIIIRLIFKITRLFRKNKKKRPSVNIT